MAVTNLRAYFRYLPKDITITILSKLPFKTILRVKAVCKEWRDIITSDTTFATTSYENTSIALVCPKVIIDCYENKSRDEERGWSYKVDPYRFDGIGDVVNSCKGFLLMKVPGSYVVYNPLTNETVFIPHVPTSDSYSCCGLGFSPVTKRFKVMVFVHDEGKQDPYGLLQMYTLGDSITSTCRTVSLAEDYRYRIFFEDEFRPIELNGLLHWNVYPRRIICFNVEKEEFDETLCTPEYTDIGRNKESNIGVYRGLLLFGINLFFKGSSRMELWVMKEYGIKESWMRLVVIKDAFLYESINGYALLDFTLITGKLVDILDTGEFIFLARGLKYNSESWSNQIYSYDPIKEGLKKLPFPNDYTDMTIDIYTPSFFSLKLQN